MIRINSLIFLILSLICTLSAAEPSTEDSVVTAPLSDSAKSANESRRIELLAKLKESNRYLYENPTSADEIFNPRKLNSKLIHRDDYSSWNDILRNHGEFVPVYYSPQFRFNRSLWRGYTVPLMGRSNSMLTGSSTILQAVPSFEPVQVNSLHVERNGELVPTLFPHDRISPQVFFLMENGLFNGNSLEFRAMRNLSRHLSLGLFSSYRQLKRDDFTHTAGGISSFYRGMKSADTNNLSLSGRNPLSESHVSTVDLRWENKSTVQFTGHYEDLSHDQIYAYEHDKKPLGSVFDSVWYNRRDYVSHLNSKMSVPVSDRMRLKVEIEASKSAYRENPVTTQVIHRDSSFSATQKYVAGGTALQFAPIERDTIAVSATFNRTSTDHADGVNTVFTRSDILLSNDYRSEGPFSAKVSGGTSLLMFENRTKAVPAAKVLGRYEKSQFSVEGWGTLDLIPTVVYLASTRIKELATDSIADLFTGGGVRATVAGDLLSLSVGYSNVIGISNRTIARYWNMEQPLFSTWNSVSEIYDNPTQVVSIVPSIGEWNGISASSSIHIADTKPYLKSTSQIDFHINKESRTRHFYTSILLNYWSERDTISFAGRDDWGKPIIDLGTKFTAEIKSFRLFLKMDNLLNRNNSYVPGYYMPGLIFRWGFAWTITG